MTEGDRALRAVIADARAVIERVAADLALSEEPWGLLTALEAEAERE